MAAINHGADAIYIGAQKFGARAAAGNSTSDIEKLAKYAHKYNANVYVTVNTILKDSEIESARRLITELYEAGADALIVQDYSILKMDIPPIALHSSTQIDTRDKEKAMFLEKARQRQKAVNKLQKHQEKLKEYEDKLDTMGFRNSYSKTDPDATFMRMKEDAMNNGQTKPGYNLQIGTENQYITNFAFYWNPTDSTTLPSFLTLDQTRWGKLPKEVCADSGYGSEQNYEFMENNGIEAYVKYNWFHKEQHRPFRNDPFRMENMYYNWEDDYYVCPMGQHMEHVGHNKSVSDNGYISWIDTYRAQRCEGCPLRGQCFKGKGNRTINVNHQLRRYKKKAFERLTSERGLFHRSKRPVEPEAVFGQIKTDKQQRPGMP